MSPPANSAIEPDPGRDVMKPGHADLIVSARSEAYQHDCWLVAWQAGNTWSRALSHQHLVRANALHESQQQQQCCAKPTTQRAYKDKSTTCSR